MFLPCINTFDHCVQMDRIIREFEHFLSKKFYVQKEEKISGNSLTIKKNSKYMYACTYFTKEFPPNLVCHEAKISSN